MSVQLKRNCNIDNIYWIKSVVVIVLTFVFFPSTAQNWSEIIEGKTFENGLIIEGKTDVLIKGCHITNVDGKYGIKIMDCSNVRIENCIIRRVGNESVSDYFKTTILPLDSMDYPQTRGGFDCIGLWSHNSSDVSIFNCDITDVFGPGIKIRGSDCNTTKGISIEKSRIAYTYDDGIKIGVENDQDDSSVLPFKGGIIRDNIIHDIGLGTSQLPYARHGMYLKARDILVEGNIIYNCFYGQGISLRNAGVIRNNKIWNCYNSCISYWAQTNTEGSTKKVVIENNQCRQNYTMNFMMRHISRLDNISGLGSPIISIAYRQSVPTAIISEFVIRGNTVILNKDYTGKSALIGGIGERKAGQSVVVENNRLIDMRKEKVYYSNMNPGPLAVMELVANMQIRNYNKSLALPAKWEHDRKPWAWTYGTFYIGLAELAKVSEDSSYYDFLKSVGNKLNWQPGPRKFHADDLCVSQMYAEMYSMYRDTTMLNPTLKRLDYLIQHPKTIALDHSLKGSNERWSWCDALFMAPTVFARAGIITGKDKYYRFMDKEFWATRDTLFNSNDSLFYRDTRYKIIKELNGKNVYWARGNGWVIGGLTIIIDNLHAKSPLRDKYIALYKKMIIKVANLQDESGFWHSSLLDPDSYPMPETSSSSFFTYGLAWGINRGFIDPEKYKPLAEKGWDALLTAIHPDGKLGWVQPIGADPKKVSFDDTDVYGVGAFLLAGSEILKMQCIGKY